MARLNLVLALLLIASGLYLVRISYESRRVFAEIENAHGMERQLESDRRRLEAERQAQATHLRVERAKALLETTHLSFDEIVERCGYSDSASFRKLFKRATAITPGDYRERYRLRPH